MSDASVNPSKFLLTFTSNDNSQPANYPLRINPNHPLTLLEGRDTRGSRPHAQSLFECERATSSQCGLMV